MTNQRCALLYSMAVPAQARDTIFFVRAGDAVMAARSARMTIRAERLANHYAAQSRFDVADIALVVKFPPIDLMPPATPPIEGDV